MANKSRDNFSSRIVNALKERAAYICSNPNCKKSTVAPSQASEDKVLYIGRAAHICAATNKGPRYDQTMTYKERSSIDNAIFLCSNCADMIDDNNGIGFPVLLLKQWKKGHEKWIADNLNKSIINDKKNSIVNVTSHNQSGGITANQVSIGSQPRIVTDDFMIQLQAEIDKRFERYNLDKNCLISIFAPPDAEAMNFGNQIKDYLRSQGYNVHKNLSSYIGNVGLNQLEVGFEFDNKQNHLELYINFNKG